jgi:hypothetical protein
MDAQTQIDSAHLQAANDFLNGNYKDHLEKLEEIFLSSLESDSFDSANRIQRSNYAYTYRCLTQMLRYLEKHSQ